VKLASVHGNPADLAPTWGKAQVHRELAALCGHLEARVRAWALDSLSKLDPDVAGAMSLDILKSASPGDEFLIAAIRVAGLLRKREAGPDLMRLSRSSAPPSVRLVAIDALGHMDGSVGSTLLDLLGTDPDAAIRAAAARALGTLGLEPFAASLAAALESDRDVTVRAEAALALGAVGGETAFGALSRRLKATLQNPDHATIACVEALARYKGRAIPVLGETLLDAHHQDILQALTRKLAPGPQETLARFANAANSEEAALGCCRQYLRSPKDVFLRQDLFLAGLHYAGRLKLPPRSPHAAAQAEESMLRRALGDEHRQIRAAAYSALPERLGREALPLLAQGLKDEDFIVRIGASVGLGQLGDIQLAQQSLRSEWQRFEPDDLHRSEILRACSLMRGAALVQGLAADAFRTTISYPVLFEAAKLIKSMGRPQLDPQTLQAVREATLSSDPQAKLLAESLLSELEKATPTKRVPER
jgi:HEAT repeat protein